MELNERYNEINENLKEMALNRMSYPESNLMTLYSVIENDKLVGFTHSHKDRKFFDCINLGIVTDSIAEKLSIQVGDPWVDSETWPNINKEEKEVINLIANYLGQDEYSIRGYVSSGGTESNLACMRWLLRYLINVSNSKLEVFRKVMESKSKNEL